MFVGHYRSWEVKAFSLIICIQISKPTWSQPTFHSQRVTYILKKVTMAQTQKACKYVMLPIVPNISQSQDKIMCIHQSWNQAMCDSGQGLIKEGFLLRFFFLQSELKHPHLFPPPIKLRYWNCDRGICALGRQLAAQLYTTYAYIWCPAPLPRCLESSQQILFVREADGTLMEHDYMSLVTWWISALPKLSVHFPAVLKTSSTMWKHENL